MKLESKTTNDSTEQRVIRIQELMQIISVSRTSIWRWVKSGDLPAPIAIGPNCVGWLSTEIHTWLESRPRIK